MIKPHDLIVKPAFADGMLMVKPPKKYEEICIPDQGPHCQVFQGFSHKQAQGKGTHLRFFPDQSLWRAVSGKQGLDPI